MFLEICVDSLCDLGERCPWYGQCCGIGTVEAEIVPGAFAAFATKFTGKV